MLMEDSRVRWDVKYPKFSGRQKTLDRPVAVIPPLFLSLLLLQGCDGPQTVSQPIRQESKAESRVQPMVSEASLMGRVFDVATGRPIDTFRLCLQDVTGVYREAVTRRYGTNDKGEFDLGSIDLGRYIVVVRAEGYQPHVRPNIDVREARSRVSFPLQRGHEVNGKVVDERTRAPIAGALVEFGTRGPCEAATSSSVANDDGRFHLDGLPSGRVTVSVAAPMFSPTTVDVMAGNGQFHEIELSQGTSVAGYVFGPDGTGCPGGTIRLIGHQTQETSSNVQGYFEFSGVEPGSHEILASITSWPTVGKSLLVGQQGIRDLIFRFETYDTSTLTGKVYGLKQSEVARVVVGGDISSDVDSTGKFVVFGIPPERGAGIAVFTSTGRHIKKKIDLFANEQASLSFDLGETSELAGRVTRAGIPVIASVIVEPLEGGVGGGTVSSHSGEYAITGISDGRQRVIVDGYPFEVDVWHETTFDIDLCNEVVVDGCREFTINGRVISGEQATPVTGARVTILGSDRESITLTDARGRFEFQHLKTGEYILSAHRPGFDVASDTITLDESASNFTLRLREVLHGQEVVLRHAGIDVSARNEVTVDVTDGDRLLSSFQLPLGANASGRLPMSLIGYDLTFRGDFERHTVRSWDGVDLMIDLSECREPTGCGKVQNFVLDIQ